MILEIIFAASAVSNLEEIKPPLVAYWLYPILTVSMVGVAVVSVVAKFARYCTYRFVPSAEISPPLATPVVYEVHVPSGVAVFPARMSIVRVVFAGVVFVYVRVVRGEATPKSITAEVNVPEVGYDPVV